MAEFTLAISIPTPQPYDDKFPTRNTENFYFAALQILQVIQGAGFKFGDVDKLTKNGLDIKTAIDGISLNVSPTDMTELVQAVQDLQYNSQQLDMGFLKVDHRGMVQDMI